MGRLRPLPGVTLRGAPDGQVQRQFLNELRQHLIGDEMLLSVLEETVDDPHRMAVAAVRDQHRHLRDLVADYEFYGRLEQDCVAVDAGTVQLLPWLDQLGAVLAARAERIGCALRLNTRSFLPDQVVLDTALCARAMQAVVDVAVQRAVPGPLELHVAYETRNDGIDGRVVFDLGTRGGGFGEVELGYVFRPFSVLDCASRALLGLSIGHRLCDLLGGELTVDSPGRSWCHYHVAFGAPPEHDATWCDPSDGGRRLGPVRPGHVLLVGELGADTAAGREALSGAGLVVEHVARLEQVLARLDQRVHAWRVVVVAGTVDATTLAGFAAASRASGYEGALVAIGGDGAADYVHLPELDVARLVALAEKKPPGR